MKLSSRQVEAWNEFLHPTVKFLIMDGAIRSGKTFSSLLAFLEWVKTAPPRTHRHHRQNQRNNRA